MTWFRTIWREFLGLFVDDGRFAIAILLWLVLVRFILPWMALPAALPPVILFIGLAVILIDSATLQASELQASELQASELQASELQASGRQAPAGPRA